MSTGNNDAGQAILQSLGEDGSCWLFVTRSEHGWAITCDGQPVVAGTSDRASIISGVQRYLSFAAAGKQPPGAAFA